MAGTRQPTDLVVLKGKKHLTKAEIEARKNAEVKAPCDKVKPPAYLSPELKKKFRKLAKELLEIKLIANVDCDALARLLIAQEKYLEVTKKLMILKVLDTMTKGKEVVISNLDSIKDVFNVTLDPAVGYRTIKVSDKYILGYGRVADFIGGDDAASEPEQPKELQCSVSDFQSYLNRQYPNTIKTNCGALLNVDNGFGEKTRNAALCVWKYEMNKKKAGYTFDLKNRNFLTKCKEYANKYAVVKNGSAGRFVYIAQGLLRAKGFYYGDLDGKAGSIVEDAIRAFQSKNGLAVDGSCGANTWTKLFKL